MRSDGAQKRLLIFTTLGIFLTEYGGEYPGGRERVVRTIIEMIFFVKVNKSAFEGGISSTHTMAMYL